MEIKRASQRLILAITTDRLPEAAKTTGFLPMTEREMYEVFYGAGLWLGPRAQLEEMPQFRQIIPYIVLLVGDKVIKYTRTPSGGEARLHGKVSVGVGGHIDAVDTVFVGVNEDILLEQTLEDAAAREVLEEIGPVDVINKTWIGLIVENDSEVGKVHIGAVAIWELAKMPEGAIEDALEKVGLTTPAELLDPEGDFPRLESWTRLLLEGCQDFAASGS